jgi:hypothetical protein
MTNATCHWHARQGGKPGDQIATMFLHQPGYLGDQKMLPIMRTDRQQLPMNVIFCPAELRPRRKPLAE